MKTADLQQASRPVAKFSCLPCENMSGFILEIVYWKCYGTKDNAVMGFVCQHMALVFVCLDL